MKEWRVLDVSNWLRYHFAFGWEYCERFFDLKIDGKKLCEFSEERLKNELGISNPIHLTRIFRDIVDSKRPLTQMKTILDSCRRDGGTFSSKFMRFDNEDVCKFARLCETPNLQQFENVFRNYYLNGLALLQADERYLMQQCKIQSVSDAYLILQAVWDVKTNKKNGANDLVNKIWNERKRFDIDDEALNMKFQLLPQHLINWIARIEEQKIENERIQQQQAAQQQAAAAAAAAQEQERALPVIDTTRVEQWSNEEVLLWLQRIGNGTMHLYQRYGEHFRVPGINGVDLLNLTPWSLENICAIHVKKHIREIITAIDRLRDEIIGRQFANDANVIEWVQQNPRRSGPAMGNINNINGMGAGRPIRGGAGAVKYENDNEMGGAAMYATSTPTGLAPACKVCGRSGDQVMRCSSCKTAYYCGRQHQVEYILLLILYIFTFILFYHIYICIDSRLARP